MGVAVSNKHGRRLARVDALLQQALLGLSLAQDRSVKRRIRQRLQRSAGIGAPLGKGWIWLDMVG